MEYWDDFSMLKEKDRVMKELERKWEREQEEFEDHIKKKKYRNVYKKGRKLKNG